MIGVDGGRLAGHRIEWPVVAEPGVEEARRDKARVQVGGHERVIELGRGMSASGARGEDGACAPAKDAAATIATVPAERINLIFPFTASLSTSHSYVPPKCV